MEKKVLTAIMIFGYIAFFIIMLNIMYPKEFEIIKYHTKKFITKFLRIFDPIIEELKRFLLY